MINLSIRKRREQMNSIIVEGKRLINDAIQSQIKIKHIYFSTEQHLQDIEHLNELVESGTRLVKVLYKDMKIYSSLAAPPGLMAVCERPNYKKPLHLKDPEHEFPFILICDQIRDSGNLGTILRTAASSGVSKVLLSPGCVDIWNTKVIKSGAGAHFRVPLYPNIAWTDIHEHLPSEEFDLFIAENKDSADEKLGKTLDTKLEKYDQVELWKNPGDSRTKVLIIGNEAFGVSTDTYDLVHKLNGTRLQIPLFNHVESLNSAVAASILMYEFRRQYDSIAK